MPIDQVAISPFDRGFLLGDSIYEVIPVYKGKMLAHNQHFQRLINGLHAIGIEPPYTPSQLADICVAVLLEDEAAQLIYIQVTRGNEQIRKHRFPIDCAPTVLIFPMSFTP